jgi:hypothetical protein
MKHVRIGYLKACALCLMAVVGGAQQPEAAPGKQPSERAESLTSWQWIQEIRLPEAQQARSFDFLITPGVLDKARTDLGDLRIYDARDREVPYALRVRRPEDKQESLPAREFNRAKNPDRSTELSLDLGKNPVEHNEIEILTGGTNFRRGVRVEGSDTDKKWSSLLDKSYLVHYQVDSRVIDIHKVRYPASRFRYLRVRVLPDSGNPEDTPAISAVAVYRSVEVRGESVTLPAMLEAREAVPADQGPGSAWYVGFGGYAVPCEQLTIDIAERDFVRPFRLEKADPDEPRSVIATGEWRRRAGSEAKPIEVRFPEVRARRLRLVVTDYRNPPLNLTGVRYSAPARQVILANGPDLSPPLRLYFGNPNAEPPGYDFAANLPAVLEPPPARGTFGSIEPNPNYQPAPKPWTERWPWLVYVVLGAASLVLLGILAALAREAISRHDAAELAERQSHA